MMIIQVISFIIRYSISSLGILGWLLLINYVIRSRLINQIEIMNCLLSNKDSIKQYNWIY